MPDQLLLKWHFCFIIYLFSFTLFIYLPRIALNKEMIFACRCVAVVPRCLLLSLLQQACGEVLSLSGLRLPRTPPSPTLVPTPPTPTPPPAHAHTQPCAGGLCPLRCGAAGGREAGRRSVNESGGGERDGGQALGRCGDVRGAGKASAGFGREGLTEER